MVITSLKIFESWDFQSQVSVPWSLYGGGDLSPNEYPDIEIEGGMLLTC